MTDRELLELAAKAAGIDARFCIGKYATNDSLGFFVINYGTSNQRGWNPLTNDGDALRLAVKLGFTVRVDKRAGFSWVKGFEGSTPHTDDPYEATRRAIVRAAAEIGKRM